MSRFKRRESPTFRNQEELDCAVGGRCAVYHGSQGFSGLEALRSEVDSFVSFRVISWIVPFRLTKEHDLRNTRNDTKDLDLVVFKMKDLHGASNREIEDLSERCQSEYPPQRSH